MNYGRLALAAVVATIVDGIYGFLVYGLLLSGEFGRYPSVFRASDAQPLPVMFVGILVGMFAVSYIFAKGYEGRGQIEGARFGVLVGILNAGYFVGTDYGILNIGRKLVVEMAAAGLIEWTLVGLAIATVYRPEPAPRAVAAGV